MTDTEINLAIAEHLGFRWELLNGNTVSILTSYANGFYDVSGGKYGWSDTGRWDYAKQTCFSAAGFAMSIAGVPDYCGDLNAMREAELSLWREEETVEEYREALQDVYVRAVGYSGAGYWFMAGAPIRAEAFLRTIGKWKSTETPPEKYVQ